MVIYYQDENDPPDCAWRWKFVVGQSQNISRSLRSFRTRRGAIDDWNEIQRVIQRLKTGNE